jgi:hypothetical protein
MYVCSNQKEGGKTKTQQSLTIPSEMRALACCIPVVLIRGAEDAVDRAVYVEERSPRVSNRAGLWREITSSLGISENRS